VQSRVSDDEWWRPVQDLIACSPEGVEDGIVEGTGKWSLTVGGEGVCRGSTLGLGTKVTPTTYEPEYHHISILFKVSRMIPSS